MAMITGSAIGSLTQQEDIYLEGAPTLFFQRYEAGPWYNPDANGFYWQLSGTAAYPVYEVGCLSDVSVADDITSNNVLCDNIGVKATIEQRNYVETTFTLKSFFPFDVLTHILRGGAVTDSSPTSQFGLGQVNNNVYWQAYWPKVYDTSVGDYVALYLAKCQFVGAFNISMTFGDAWSMPVTLRGVADSTKPAAQAFGSFVRSDLSVIT